MQALVMRTMAESGESIVRFRPRLAQDNLRVPLQLQLLERLPGPRAHHGHGQRVSDAGSPVRPTGPAAWPIGSSRTIRAACWSSTRAAASISQPVPADQILHTYRVLRPGQIRGVPWLTPVMLALRDLDDYADAERVRKKIEACVVAMITQPEGIEGSWLGFKGNDPLTTHPVESFQPGMTAYLKPGEDVKFNNPPALGGYREYKTTELEEIAAGLGLPYELMTGDLSKVNYSSWRGGQWVFGTPSRITRWLTLIPMFCMPVRRRVIDTLVMLGKIPAARGRRSGNQSVRHAVDGATV